MPSPIIQDLFWPTEMAWYRPASSYLLLLQHQQTQGCLQHHLVHVSVVNAIGFCVFNTTVVTQGTHDPNPANPILLTKAELNFNQLKLTCETLKRMRNQCTERPGSKGATNLGRLKEIPAGANIPGQELEGNLGLSPLLHRHLLLPVPESSLEPGFDFSLSGTSGLNNIHLELPCFCLL